MMVVRFVLVVLCVILGVSGGVDFKECQANEFQNALTKAQLLGASSAKFHANLARVIVDNDPVEAAEYIAKVKEFRKAFESPEELEKEQKANESYVASIGVSDVDWLTRAAGAVLHKDEERFWTFIEQISREMLNRLPRFKSSRETVQDVFINRIIFELKFKFSHYLASFNSIAASSKIPEVNEFGRFLEGLQRKMEKDQKITTAEIAELSFSLRKLFSDFSIVYDDVAVYVELLEVYNSFQEIKTSKGLRANRGSLVDALRKAGEFSTVNNQLVKECILRDSELLNSLKIERLPREVIPLILAQQDATISGDAAALATATFNTILTYLDLMGKAKLVEVVREFMSGVPAGEFLPDAGPKKKQSQNRNKADTRKGRKVLASKKGSKSTQAKAVSEVDIQAQSESESELRSAGEKKATFEENAGVIEQRETSPLSPGFIYEQGKSLAKAERHEPSTLITVLPVAIHGELGMDHNQEERSKAVRGVFDLDARSAEELPKAMQGELDAQGEMVSEADLDDYLQYRDQHHPNQHFVKDKARFAKSFPSSDEAPSVDKKHVTEIRLSGLGAMVFQIASGQAFNDFQVGNRHFLDLLRQLRGGLIRSTGKGKGSARQYALPNLRDKAGARPHNFYHLHAVHGGRDFNPKTLRALLGRDLEDSGYLNNPGVRIIIE